MRQMIGLCIALLTLGLVTWGEAGTVDRQKVLQCGTLLYCEEQQTPILTDWAIRGIACLGGDGWLLIGGCTETQLESLCPDLRQIDEGRKQELVAKYCRK